MAALIHLIYASVATQRFGTPELGELLQQARCANDDKPILTGMLPFSDGNFFQVLEGNPAEVDKLYRKLELDQRHAQLTVVLREPIVKRYFESWSMGFSQISLDDLKSMDGVNDFFQAGSCFVELNPGRAKKLLAAFADGRWRAKIGGTREVRV